MRNNLKLSNLLLVVIIATTSSLKANEETIDPLLTLGFLGAAAVYVCSKPEPTVVDALFLSCCSGFALWAAIRLKKSSDLTEACNNLKKERNDLKDQQITLSHENYDLKNLVKYAKYANNSQRTLLLELEQKNTTLTNQLRHTRRRNNHLRQTLRGRPSKLIR